MTAVAIVLLIWLAITAATLLVEWLWPECDFQEDRVPGKNARRRVGTHYSGPRIPSAVSAPGSVGPSAGQAESGDLTESEMRALWGDR